MQNDRLLSFEQALRLARECEEGKRGDVGSWLEYCVVNGIYQFICQEFADALARLMRSLAPASPIEICAGDGLLGRALRLRGIPVKSTDAKLSKDKGNMNKAGEARDFVSPEREEVETLSVRDALDKYDPDLVIGCWVPIDADLDLQVMRHPTVRRYIYIGQELNGILGPDAIWREPGWDSAPIPDLDRYSLCRSDYFGGSSGDILVQHGKSVLFTRRR